MELSHALLFTRYNTDMPISPHKPLRPFVKIVLGKPTVPSGLQDGRSVVNTRNITSVRRGDDVPHSTARRVCVTVFMHRQAFRVGDRELGCAKHIRRRFMAVQYSKGLTVSEPEMRVVDRAFFVIVRDRLRLTDRGGTTFREK